MEIWKDIPGYEKLYQVSNKSRVRSLDRKVIYSKGGFRIFKGKILKSTLSPQGYLMYSLWKDRKKKTHAVHSLLAITFLDHVPNGFKGAVVDHVNNIKTDNRLCNLQLISSRENTTKDRFRYDYSSKYTGVSWNKSDKRWKADIFINGKAIYLGYFECEIEASKCYINALEAYNSSQEIKINRKEWSSKHEGINLHPRDKVWEARIKTNGKHKYIGRFKTELEAYEYRELYINKNLNK